MDPNLVLHPQECRKNELCESRVFNMWEGKRFFQMQAYDDPQKHTNLLWSFEVLAFGPSPDALSPKANEKTTALQQTLAQTLVKKTLLEPEDAAGARFCRARVHRAMGRVKEAEADEKAAPEPFQ